MQSPSPSTVSTGEPAGTVPHESYLEVKNLIKWFGKDRAVDNVSFSIPKGHFLTLLGPSGCGKTTTLMSIAGLHSIDEGSIRVGGMVYTDPAKHLFLAPEQRDIGMVFQSYAIWPHMTVAQNVAYPLEIRKIDRSEIEARVADTLKLIGLADFADKLATQLSGGQQQRASLARAIVAKPRLLLFDEPLSNLDLKLREKMRVELKRIQKEVGITSIYVTHDQSEALVMSDDIIVMSKGRIEQKGGPVDIYMRPVNSYVSNFIGVANLLKGRVFSRLEGGFGEVEVQATDNTKALLAAKLHEDMKPGSETVLSIRPENVRISRTYDGPVSLVGRVEQAIFLGNCIDARVSWGGFEWKVLAHPRSQLMEGETVFLKPDPNHTLAVQP